MSKLVWRKSLPAHKQIQTDLQVKNVVLLVDARLAEQKDLAKWLQNFSKVLTVPSGESLKTLEEYSRLVLKLLPFFEGHVAHDSVLVVVGGGTIGDMGGFLASTIKRGVRLAHMPSTWLAAIDSAHGGKTGLNVGSYKNQIGTFYSAHKTYMVQSLLFGQPKANIQSGLGEALKMALISGGPLFISFERAKIYNENLLWRVLPMLVERKLQVVKKDPLEHKGYRRILNFGHTLGHAMELDHLLPHGVAIQMGMDFALDWSLQLGLLKETSRERIRKVIRKNPISPTPPLMGARLRLRLAQDKKATSASTILFIFLKDIGKPEIREVYIDELMVAAQKMGWVQP